MVEQAQPSLLSSGSRRSTADRWTSARYGVTKRVVGYEVLATTAPHFAHCASEGAECSSSTWRGVVRNDAG